MQLTPRLRADYEGLQAMAEPEHVTRKHVVIGSGEVSKQCGRGDHRHCYVLKCGCSCGHGAGE